MHAYRDISLKLKGYGVKERAKVWGYFKIGNKPLLGRSPENHNSDIRFNYLKEGHKYQTFIKFSYSSRRKKPMISTLDDVVLVQNWRSLDYTVNTMDNELTDQERKFYAHVQDLLCSELARLIPTLDLVGGGTKVSDFRKNVAGYPEGFDQLCVEKYAKGKVLDFGWMFFPIQPEDWGMVKLVGGRKNRHPTYHAELRADNTGMDVL